MLKRDFSSPTLEDHFNKTVLPKVMQVLLYLSGKRLASSVFVLLICNLILFILYCYSCLSFSRLSYRNVVVDTFGREL